MIIDQNSYTVELCDILFLSMDYSSFHQSLESHASQALMEA
jgi:hypothetical protein